MAQPIPQVPVTGTAAELAAVRLAKGQLAHATDTGDWYVGDGAALVAGITPQSSGTSVAPVILSYNVPSVALTGGGSDALGVEPTTDEPTYTPTDPEWASAWGDPPVPACMLLTQGVYLIRTQATYSQDSGTPAGSVELSPGTSGAASMGPYSFPVTGGASQGWQQLIVTAESEWFFVYFHYTDSAGISASATFGVIKIA